VNESIVTCIGYCINAIKQMEHGEVWILEGRLRRGLLMLLLGDIHGEFEILEMILLQHPNQKIIQLGDFGLGFDPVLDQQVPKTENLEFIRGNHDNPDVCRRHHYYKGDYGYKNGVFWLSGALSVDKHHRIEGVNWWATEELSMEVLSDAVECYIESKPRVVLSHEIPVSVIPYILGRHGERSRTSSALQVMIENHEPEYWYFGHYHTELEFLYGGCIFRCVDINEIIECKGCC